MDKVPILKNLEKSLNVQTPTYSPDWNGIYINNDKKTVVCHERLSIIDVDNGAQPLYGVSDDGVSDMVLSVNGEIYNHQGIKDVILQGRHDIRTGSDCEVILIYIRNYLNFLNILDGVFTFFVYDSMSDDFLVARDPIGVNPLYYAVNDIGEYCFSSELKSLENGIVNVKLISFLRDIIWINQWKLNVIINQNGTI